MSRETCLIGVQDAESIPRVTGVRYLLRLMNLWFKTLYFCGKGFFFLYNV